MTIAYNSAYVQTETLNFTFARQIIIVYFDAKRWVLMYVVKMASSAARHVRRVAGMAIFACVKCFLLNPDFDLEPDYMGRKPMKDRFQLCIVHIEILSTFHTRVEYISRRTIRHSAHSNQWECICRIIVAKTTSGFNCACTIWQYTHSLLLESPFVPSSTDCWAVWAKIMQKRPSRCL